MSQLISSEYGCGGGGGGGGGGGTPNTQLRNQAII